MKRRRRRGRKKWRHDWRSISSVKRMNVREREEVKGEEKRIKRRDRGL